MCTRPINTVRRIDCLIITETSTKNDISKKLDLKLQEMILKYLT